jgi:hypothetical protein
VEWSSDIGDLRKQLRSLVTDRRVHRIGVGLRSSSGISSKRPCLSVPPA